MEVKIQSIHFDATEKLQAFIQYHGDCARWKPTLRGQDLRHF